jgi:peptide/nickel transport system ATP-binding protein
MNIEKTLELKNLKTQFITKDKSVTAVNEVSYHINEGEILGLVGESGCGKSVTALSIMQLLKNTPGKITGGEVIFRGKNLVEYTEKEMTKIRGREISMIFQEPISSLNPTMKIGAQIVELILKHKKMSMGEAKALALSMLEKVGIPRALEIMYEFPHQLSGGMNQRVGIAMGMSLNPALLIADEPTTALDVTIQAQILELMRYINKEFQMSILLITHDLGVVAEMCHRVVVMYAGKIVEEANVIDLFETPNHPYTKGLLASTPILGKRERRLNSIRGNVPPLDKMPPGCAFAPRCDNCFEKCNEEAPPIFILDGENGVRKSRCWLSEEMSIGTE